MIQTILTWIWLGSGVLLVISVLLHSPKGDGMGGLASSGGSMFSSARSAEARSTASAGPCWPSSWVWPPP
jgi:preprotein translocase subunit SecG